MTITGRTAGAVSSVRATLACGADTAARARRMARDFLGGLPSPAPAEVADAIDLVVSELVTNAVRHARSEVCSIELTGAAEGVRIAVSDLDPTPPRPRTPDLHGGGGFGWPLVRRLSTSVEVESHAAGKTVCAVVATG